MKFLKIGAYILLTTVMLSCGGDENSSNNNSSNNTNSSVSDSNNNSDYNAVCIWPKAVPVYKDAMPGSDNYLTSVQSGDKVMITDENQTVNYNGKDRKVVKIKMGDGKEGWARFDFLAKDAKIGVAYKNNTAIYKRPDELNKITDKTFSEMDVIAVYQEKGDWLEIKGKRRESTWYTEGWIKKSDISFDEKDIMVSHLAHRAKAHSKEEKKEAALNDIMNNSDLKSSQLFNSVSDYVNE